MRWTEKKKFQFTVPVNSPFLFPCSLPCNLVVPSPLSLGSAMWLAFTSGMLQSMLLFRFPLCHCMRTCRGYHSGPRRGWEIRGAKPPTDTWSNHPNHRCMDKLSWDQPRSAEFCRYMRKKMLIVECHEFWGGLLLIIIMVIGSWYIAHNRFNIICTLFPLSPSLQYSKPSCLFTSRQEILWGKSETVQQPVFWQLLL